MLLLFLSFAGNMLAQQGRCRIYGTVKDEKGSPIELASVRIDKQPSSTITNLNGKYSIYCTSRDTVTIIYSMIGYETRKRTIHNPVDSIRIDVMLPSFDAKFGEAIVTGQQIQTGTMQRITPKDLKISPSTTGNGVEEIIATQAGVSTHNELSSQYNVRGGSFDENCVYLNGVEVYRPMLVRSGQQEGLSIINPNMVEQIGFSSGGFEARYGDRMSSVLDITYKRPEAFEASVSASMLGAGAYVGWGNKHVSLMTSIRYKTTRYLLGTMDTSGEYNPNFLDYQAYFSWRPNRRWSFEAIGNISDNHYNFEPEDRETKFGTMQEAKSFKVYFDGQEEDYFRTLFGSMTLTRHFNPNTFLALQLSSFSTKEQETYDIQGEYWLNEATSQEQLGVGTYMEHARNKLRANVFNTGLRFRTKLTGHVLQAGLNWQRESIKENAREWEMRDSMGYSLPHQPDRLALIYSQRSQNSLQTNRFEAYAQDTWRFKSKIGLFNLTYGLRFSYWDWNKEILVSPRASLGLMPSFSEHWTFRFATGVYYQAPFYKELRDTIITGGISTVKLNKDIKSQRSIHFVLGGDYTFRMMNRPFKFTTEVYYKALSNLIPYSVDNVRVVYYGRNMSKGYATGIDFKLFGEFVPGTDSWITFSIMSTKEKLHGKWLPRPTDQRYNLSLYFTDYFPGTDRWKLALKAAFADGLPFGPPHTDRAKHTFRAPAYKRVDVGLSYRLIDNEDKHLRRFGRFIKNAWLGLDAFNLLGIKNVNSYYWVTDITNTRYAVPNYLTGRQINVRLNIDF
ncbi:MAG: carboxypeptidase-like regulatory domain-containing protein [Bacteroidaceae bacterium]|nr:carboxypeptidase-like regulatory domain-containing protein [Bacteroidaceae bacterium]MBR2863537.1 carboxypeptidase-like regulatory domain-containing protein [Bacteroidaceae bacterium]